jgi:hypothetical protein
MSTPNKITYDDLVRTARDAGCAVSNGCGGMVIPQSVLNAMSLAVAAEREACAKAAMPNWRIAEAIRARGAS